MTVSVARISKDGMVVKAELCRAAGGGFGFPGLFDDKDLFTIFLPASLTAHRVGAAGGISLVFV